MKKHFTLIALSLITASAVAQVQNPSFETWASGNPSSWTSSNVAGIFNNVQESSDAHAGSKAADLVVGSFAGNYVGGIVFQQNVPYTGAAENVTVWYKGELSDEASLSVTLTYSDASDNILYATSQSYTSSAAVYTAAVVVPEMVMAGTISKMGLTISLMLASNSTPPSGNPHVLVDDVQMGGIVSTNEIENAVSKVNVFPNPTSENCTLSITSVSNQKVSINVFDLQGRLVLSETKLVTIGTNKMDLNLSDLTAGMYAAVIEMDGEKITQQIVKQ
ncbi:MAG: T9SS type A sorting domain-containing protein [Flavobacteriales bacterium]